MLDARPVAQSALLRLSVFLVCLGYGALSHAHMGPNVKLPGSYFFVGPSVAWVGGDVEGVALNLDAAYSVSFFALSLNLKYLHGEQADGRPVRLFGPQLELSAWFFVTVGGGVGFVAGKGSSGLHLNTFVGVPIPVEVQLKAIGSLVVQPYYRANWVGNDWSTYHEVGLFVKITNYR
jgi:hypothetical protein